MGPPATNMPVDPFCFYTFRLPAIQYPKSHLTIHGPLEELFSSSVSGLILSRTVQPHLSSINATHALYKLILTHNSVKARLHKAKHINTITPKYFKSTLTACFRFIRNHTTK